jgi:phospholipase/lecithinase/hemolysin
MKATQMRKHITTSVTRRQAIGFAAALGWLLAAATVYAQPVIGTQPRSLSVLLGETATFSVVASPTPLTYEWQHDGITLADATNRSVTVSNVALSDLGSYTVRVRNDAGETPSQPAWLKLARWTEFLYFGHSLGMMEFTNGKTWFEYLAEMLGIPTAGRYNHAEGGATSAEIRAQIVTYLNSHKPGSHTLAALWLPGSDMITAPPQQTVSNTLAQVLLLADAGTTCFLIPNLGNPLHHPVSAPYAQVITDYEHLLEAALVDLRLSRQLIIFRPDFYALEEAIWANPGAYGFTNLTDQAKACDPLCDASKYYFWDSHHTTAAHKVWTPVFYRSLVPPLVVSGIRQASDNELTLQWQGGSPPFRLQRCADLAGGVWQSDELTFVTSAIVASPSPIQFFRVLQLGQ